MSITLIAIAVFILVAIFRLWLDQNNEDNHVQPTSISMQITSPEEYKRQGEAKLNRLKAVLMNQGFIFTGYDETSATFAHTFKIPNVNDSFKLITSHKPSATSLTITGTIPADSPLHGVHLMDGVYIERTIKATPEQTAWIDAIDLLELTFPEDLPFKGVNASIEPDSNTPQNTTFKFTFDLHNPGDLNHFIDHIHKIEAVITRSTYAWRQSFVEACLSPQASEHTSALISHLIAWSPTDINTLQHASNLSLWVKLPLWHHLHTRSRAPERQDHHVGDVETILLDSTHPPQLRLIALELYLPLSGKTLSQQDISSILTSLVYSTPNNKQWGHILAKIPQTATGFFTQVAHIYDEVTSHHFKKTTHLEEVPESLANFFGQNWSKAAPHAYELKNWAAHNASPEAALFIHVLLSSNVQDIEEYTRDLFKTGVLSAPKFLMWQRCIEHRTHEVAQHLPTLKYLARLVLEKKAHYFKVGKLLVAKLLPQSPHKVEVLQHLITHQPPLTAQLWEVYASHATIHLFSEPQLLTTLLELLEHCPNENAAKEPYAQLDQSLPEVQNFLLSWRYTPSSTRLQLMQNLQHTPDALDQAQEDALCKVLLVHHFPTSFYLGVLSIMEQKGSKISLIALSEATKHKNFNKIQTQLNNTLHILKERLSIQGGELSMSNPSAQGGLTISKTKSS